jgi:hypothetical protein
MIFFGSKCKTITGQVVDGVQCPSCDNKQFITFGLLKYFHIYWVPTVPTSKKVGMECTHCKKTLIGKELPAELSAKIKKTVFTTPKTLPMFSGLVLLLGLIAFVVYVGRESELQEATFIEQPVVNDMYTVNIKQIIPGIDSKYDYSLIRIKSIDQGQVEFQVSNYAYNKTKGVNKDILAGKAASDAYYSDVILVKSLSEIKALYESGAIKDIDRL